MAIPVPTSKFWRFMFRQYITSDNRWTLSGSAVRDNLAQSSPAGAALVAEHDARKRARAARKHQRHMTVAGAVVGGLVGGGKGAVELAAAEHFLNDSGTHCDRRRG